MLQEKHSKWEIHECQSYMCWTERHREKKFKADISPEFSSLITGGNFVRTKLRGLRSQEELLSAQHICKSVHLLKCLNRGFDI